MPPSSDRDGNPELGNHPSVTEKIMIKYRPSQNVGTDAASIAPLEVTWSTHVPCFVADRTPIGKPNKMIQTIVIDARRIEVSAPLAMTDKTGSRKKMEIPRSPCKTLPSQRKYWVASGRSNPISAESCATSSGVAVSPKGIAAGSPGIK